MVVVVVRRGRLPGLREWAGPVGVLLPLGVRRLLVVLVVMGCRCLRVMPGLVVWVGRRRPRVVMRLAVRAVRVAVIRVLVLLVLAALVERPRSPTRVGRSAAMVVGVGIRSRGRVGLVVWVGTRRPVAERVVRLPVVVVPVVWVLMVVLVVAGGRRKRWGPITRR